LWLAERKEEIIEKGLCETLFGWKKDGSVATDLGDMTYEETLLRMVRLMFVSHEKRWVTGWSSKERGRKYGIRAAEPYVYSISQKNLLPEMLFICLNLNIQKPDNLYLPWYPTLTHKFPVRFTTRCNKLRVTLT